MSFNSDNGVDVVRVKDAKVTFGSGSTWATRLSQIKKAKGRIYIATFSLPDLAYAQAILGKRPRDIYIVAHSKFMSKAIAIKAAFPEVHIGVRDDIHAKFVLVPKDIVWLSSANFGHSGWLENTIGLHSQDAFDFYKLAFEQIYDKSTEVKGIPKTYEDTGHDEEYPEEIKPCPICGREMTEEDIVFHNDSVYIACPCGAYGGLAGRVEHTIKQWNDGTNIMLKRPKGANVL